MSDKWKYSLPIIMVMVFLLGGCSSKGNVAKLVAEDAGSTIEINKGDVIEVTLAGNITTGYTWEWVKPDSSIFDLQGDPEYKSESDLVGAPGVQVFRFMANSVGTEELNLIYHRTFEPDVPPLEEFKVQITVN